MSFELALQEIQRHTRVYKAFQEAENALVTLVSLEQHTKELQHSRVVLEASLVNLTRDIKIKQTKYKEAEAQHKEMEDLLRESSHETEKQRLFETNYKAENLTKRKEKEKELEIISTRIAKLEAKATERETFVRTKQQEVEALESRLTGAREQVQRLLSANS